MAAATENARQSAWASKCWEVRTLVTPARRSALEVKGASPWRSKLVEVLGRKPRARTGSSVLMPAPQACCWWKWGSSMSHEEAFWGPTRRRMRCSSKIQRSNNRSTVPRRLVSHL